MKKNYKNPLSFMSWNAAWRSFGIAHFRMDYQDMRFYYKYLQAFQDDAPDGSYMKNAAIMMKEARQWEK